ncbi:unnamed protein product [Rhizoctonia solani]|uniref:Uncharacterized protein n=1 Tax=Rhizoctonia solani TaxID=456999 RepID=A0A8H3DGI9_9AGAM|nr:unnamed protein product [Rhizoctonia solani]
MGDAQLLSRVRYQNFFIEKWGQHDETARSKHVVRVEHQRQDLWRPGSDTMPSHNRYDDITITSGDDHVPKSAHDVTLIYRLHPSNFSSCNMEQMGVVCRIYASPGWPSVSRPSNPFTSTPILNYRPPSIIVSEFKDSFVSDSLARACFPS